MKKFFGVIVVVIVCFAWGIPAFAGKDYVPNTELTAQTTTIGSEVCSASGPWPVPNTEE